MTKNLKLLVSFLPFLAAAAFASSLTYPQYLDDQDKSAQVASKQVELEVLEKKLQALRKAEQEKETLENEIKLLRGAVPKSAELDLLMIDLEKMCAAANVDLIAVETPGQDVLKGLGESEDETKSAGESGNQPPAALKPGQKNTGKQDPQKDKARAQSGLKRLIKQVFITGDYNGIVSLMKKLESYERIVGVNNISVVAKSDSKDIERTAAAERGQKLKLDQPVMSFLISLYYLP